MLAITMHEMWGQGYGLMLVTGMLVGGLLWSRRVKGRPELGVALAGGLVGALIGAKLGYLFAEGLVIWNSEAFLRQALVGKTVLGALLGGYLGVEIAKRLIHHRAPTGDHFAVAVPIGLALGRIGCLMHGCCRGVVCEAHWWTIPDGEGGYYYPAAASELVFNLFMATLLATMLRAKRLPGQLFHVYLIAYGLFRFGHEFVRDTPPLIAGLTGYQLLAVALVLLGAVRFVQRARDQRTPLTPPSSRGMRSIRR